NSHLVPYVLFQCGLVHGPSIPFILPLVVTLGGHTSRSGVVPFSGTPTKKRLKARRFQPLYSDDF
ncbi:MAG TPA: hypothetical protein VLY04_22860, partial [Bryobacteraceae bacterium]|nr:hypothetical protein [Bryobacteraceae bacterium]